MPYDYAIHSDFLVHWTGKDLDEEHDRDWGHEDKSWVPEGSELYRAYIARLRDTLKHGIWLTAEPEQTIHGGIRIPSTPKTCFTELKVSESRIHAKKYGRLGIGVKRPFVFSRYGRPLAYFGYHGQTQDDRFLQACAKDLRDQSLLNFFKPMNSSTSLNYDLYSESEWRIVFMQELLDRKLLVDPRDATNRVAHAYFQSLPKSAQEKLRYLAPLDGWLAIIIYPSLPVKNAAQQHPDNGIAGEIRRIKSDIADHGNKVERGNLPIEMDLDSCRHF